MATTTSTSSSCLQVTSSLTSASKVGGWTSTSEASGCHQRCSRRSGSSVKGGPAITTSMSSSCLAAASILSTASKVGPGKRLPVSDGTDVTSTSSLGSDLEEMRASSYRWSFWDCVTRWPVCVVRGGVEIEGS